MCKILLSFSKKLSARRHLETSTTNTFAKFYTELLFCDTSLLFAKRLCWTYYVGTLESLCTSGDSLLTDDHKLHQVRVLGCKTQRPRQQQKSKTRNIRNNGARSCNHCCIGKAISITYYECVYVASGMQHAMRMLRICHLWPVRLYHIFPHSHKWHDFRKKKKKSLNTKCVFWFSPQRLSATLFILWRIERDIINVQWSSCEASVMPVRF